MTFSTCSCDLAGSERVKKTKAEGERLQEAQSINSSLLELGYVSVNDPTEVKIRYGPCNGICEVAGP